ncbi:MAG: class I SAM-dependent methyltransferase [Bacteroidota bacterium]|nr:class I SAM-dependent methyltransferase [Bacteroidota bacterium]
MRRLRPALLLLLYLPAALLVAAQQRNTDSAYTKQLYTYQKPSRDGTGKFYLRREIAQVMDASGAGWLERGEREAEEAAEKAIDSMRLKQGMSVADIGAGTGYYSFRMARIIRAGRVYAVEVQPAFIDYLRNKKAQLKDSVVVVTQGKARSPELASNSIDLAIMVDVYHELLYPKEMLDEIRKALRPSGKLLLIEYRGEDPELAIKPLHKTTVRQLNRELAASGFTLDYKGEFLPQQHFLVYRKGVGH